MIVHRAACGFEQRRFGFDFDGLSRLADLQLDVQFDLIADAEDDAGLLIELEAGLLDGERVLPGGESEEVVFAVSVGRDFESRGGGLLLDGYFGFGNCEG